MKVLLLLLVTSGALAKKPPPRPAGAAPILECPEGLHEVLKGTLEQWCADDEGRRQGPVRYWATPTRLQAAGEALDDRLHGPWTEYHPDGTPRVQGAYERGSKVGAWTTTYPDGKPLLVVHFVDGVEQGTSVSTYPTGRRESEGQYQDGLRVGVWKSWHDNGQLRSERTYVDGVEQPGATWFDRNGNPTPPQE